jgi:hypothetical protein
VRGEYRFTRLNDDHRSFTLEESVGSNRRLEFDRDIDVHTVRGWFTIWAPRATRPSEVGTRLGLVQGRL